MKNRNDIEKLLKTMPHYLKVKFVLHCCNDIKDLITQKEGIHCIMLATKWLHNPGSVSADDLYAAANAAAHAAHAANAAHAATNAAYTDKKIDKYYWDLVEIIKELSPLEKVIYNINQ